MTRLLQIDASARPGRAGEHPHGSQSRRLTHRFVSRWLEARAHDSLQYRDLGVTPPAPIDAGWMNAAFVPPEARDTAMRNALAGSDALVAELAAADVLVLGVPMYNYGMPAVFKAWVDNIVRIGVTFDFDRSRPHDPYVPLLADRPRHAVLLSSRGGHGYGPQGPLAALNHLDPAVRAVLSLIGFDALTCIAIEHEEDGGELLAASVDQALAEVDRLVDRLLATAYCPEMI